MLEYGGTLRLVIVFSAWMTSGISLLIATAYSLKIAKIAKGATIWRTFAITWVLSLIFFFLIAYAGITVKSEPWEAMLFLLAVCTTLAYTVHRVKREIRGVRK